MTEIREGIAKLIVTRASRIPEEGMHCYDVAGEILSYLHSQGVVILEERVQRYSEQTGKPIKATPYRILTSLI